MVINNYFKLNMKSYLHCPTKESLGHKNIGVEPDLIFDLSLGFPRLFIRNDVSYIIDDIKVNLIEAAYVNSKSNHAYMNFFTIDKVSFDLGLEDWPKIFYHEDSLWLSIDFLDDINECKSIVDIEYRV